MSKNFCATKSLRRKSVACILEPVVSPGLRLTRQTFTAAAAALALTFAVSGTAGAAPLWSGGITAGGPVAISWNSEALAAEREPSRIILAESVPEPEPPSCNDKKSSRAGKPQNGRGEARAKARLPAQCSHTLTRHGKKIPCNGVAQFADFIFLGLLFD